MLEIFVFSIKMMMKNKIRSLLTMLGIVIGILSLILIVVFGNSFSETFKTITNTLFKNDQMIVSIVPTDDNKNVVYDEYGQVVLPEGISFDIRDVNKELEKMEGNSYLSTGGFLDNKTAFCDYQGKKLDFFIVGSCSNEVSLSSYSICKGRDFSRMDEKNYASVCIVADVVARYYFGDEDPIGKTLNVTIDRAVVPVVVVGLYQYPRQVSSEEMGKFKSLFFINHTYLENQFEDLLDSGYWKKGIFVISMLDVKDKDAFKKDLEKRLNNILNQKKWTLNLYSVSEQVNSINEMVNIISKIVFVIAALSLFIGGIGIMNVMLMTVTERTNEIGVRKALGAENWVIIYQFLCESFVLSLSGTIIGVVLAMVISKVLAIITASVLQTSLKIPVSIDVSLPFSAAVFAVIGSIFIGVIFGLYPAIKAVKMQVVDALRYE